MYVGIYASSIRLDFPANAHVTLAYGKIQPTEKVTEETNAGLMTTVVSVEYWKQADVTVLVLEKTDELERLFNFYRRKHFAYDEEFIPHITVAKGNEVVDWSQALEERVELSDVYYQIKESK